ncbi:IS30 family transposase [Mycolicibacterium gilvum]|nr:IS30 family transposase [Mycolicibacterium gilvum]
MPPISLAVPTGRYLSFEEREEIALLRAKQVGVREIARRIGRDPATISRELRRNAATRSGKQEYRALVAQWKAQQTAKRPKTAKLATNDRLREYVQERLGRPRGAQSRSRTGGTIVERKSRSTLLVHLPRLQGYGEIPPVKNGPALGGYGAVAMNDALIASMTKLPEQLRKTLTWDRGKELSGHAQFALATGTKVFFADPHSPWQRPTNENTNGLLRQYFPKGTDLSRWSAEDLEAVALALNNRPRKSLDWKTPAEVFEEQLRSLQ